MSSRRLIPDPPAGLRERARADGSTRIWWEPSAAARALGFAAVELDEKRLTWSRREAEKLNVELARAQRDGRRGVPSAGSRTIEALIHDYTRSLSYSELADKSRASYTANFRQIVRKWGQHQVRDFTKPVMRTWYETLVSSSGDYQAVALLRAMSVLFTHAELRGWRAEGTNPCSRLKLRIPQPRARIASWAEIDAIVAAADRIGLPSIGTATLLSVLQGQRQTDVIEARVADFRVHARHGGAIQWTFTRSKRGNAAAMWVHDLVAPRVRALLSPHGDDTRRLLRDEMTGSDYDVDLFGRRWRAARDAAIAADKNRALNQLSTLQYRDLRRTFGVLSRAGGATRDDTADVLGNSAATNPRLAQTYMPAQLDTASRAVRAIKRPTRKGGAA